MKIRVGSFLVILVVGEVVKMVGWIFMERGEMLFRVLYLDISLVLVVFLRRFEVIFFRVWLI